MKRTDTVTKIIVLLLFLALASYLGVYLWRYFSADYKSVLISAAAVRDTGAFRGVVIRDEAAVGGSLPFFAVTAPDKSRVASGGVLALEWPGPDSPALRERRYLQRTERLLLSSGGVDAAARELSMALGRGDYAAAGLFAEALGSVSLKTSREIDRGMEEIAGAIGGAALITAPFSGIFSESADGLEHLSPELLTEALTPADISGFLAETPYVPPGVVGRLTSGVYWYIAAVINEADAGKLAEGGTAVLEIPGLGRQNAGVFALCQSGGGERAVVFRIDRDLISSFDYRAVDGLVLFSENMGLRLPESALYETASGTGVYTESLGRAVFHEVTVVDRRGGYAVVISGDGSLSPGDNALIGDRLSDGAPLSG